MINNKENKFKKKLIADNLYGIESHSIETFTFFNYDGKYPLK